MKKTRIKHMYTSGTKEINCLFQGVVCAQCFHWFSQTGLDEIHRVLKPGGSLVLIWNTKDLRTKWLNDVINHYKKYKEPSEPWFYDFSWKERLDKMPGFYMSLLQDRLHYPSLQVGIQMQVTI